MGKSKKISKKYLCNFAVEGVSHSDGSNVMHVRVSFKNRNEAGYGNQDSPGPEN